MIQSLVMTSLLFGGEGGAFRHYQTEVEFGHDKFAFWGRGGGEAFRHYQTQVVFAHDESSPPWKAKLVMTKLNFSFGPDESPPPPKSKLVMTKLNFSFGPYERPPSLFLGHAWVDLSVLGTFHPPVSHKDPITKNPLHHR